MINPKYFSQKNVVDPIKKGVIGLLLMLVPFLSTAQDTSKVGDTSNLRVIKDTSRLRIVFAGDMMGHMPLVSSTYNDSLKTYDYSPIFTYIKPFISSADLAVVNLEVTLAGPPFSGYPQFSSPDALANCLKEVGFNVLITANNHSLDRRKKGVERTITVLDSLQILHTGTFKDSVEKNRSYPLIVNKNNISVAFLNYTYGTNGIQVQSPNIINYIDTAEIRKDIKKCQGKVDFIIVTTHWGVEYERFPNNEQRKLADFIRKCGANAIVGSHPHVIQPLQKIYNVKDSSDYIPVLYSLGNFVSNQRDRYTNGGIIYELDLEKVISTKIKSYGYLPVWVFKGIIDGKTSYRLIPRSFYEDAVKSCHMDAQSKQDCQEFFKDTNQHLQNMVEIISNKL
jgi:poly-gamma-glutamate synthesis protein (capsule biosynthesis protein)